MGMYNEVYACCPDCKSRCELQISQIVLGFGCFDLDSPEQLHEELTWEQKQALKRALDGKKFHCEKEYCQNSFEVEINF
jgi:hypothetical protein